MSAPADDVQCAIRSYIESADSHPLFVCGDALHILQAVPDDSIDCAITSPPYWGHRQYSTAGIGQEPDYKQYIGALIQVFTQVKRVLKPAGSFWLNLGDAYHQKQLLGIPWRVAPEMTDQHGWLLRNSVIWHKVKGGPDNATDKLRNVHEHLFHFAKSANYFYDVDAIRHKPAAARIVNGAVVSATGVSGVRYRRQIELSTALSPGEKLAALAALQRMLEDVRAGRLADFRMILRGGQRATHSNAESVSGRAKELAARGFYFLRYHPNGSKPKDVWDIMPEDTQRRESHYAPFPEDLCKIPILATCPAGGIVLDPFCGTGTAMRVAFRLGRRSLGIDISPEYLQMAERRSRDIMEVDVPNQSSGFLPFD
jgi:DNA modification methylase